MAKVVTLLGTNRDNKMSIIDINVLLHQTPGGMLSNLINQLKEMDALDKVQGLQY